MRGNACDGGAFRAILVLREDGGVWGSVNVTALNDGQKRIA